MRILILEDDPITAGLLVHVLQQEGMFCHHAQTVRDALGCFQREPFDIALVDRMLGNEDGMDFVRWLRDRHPATGIIIISACSVTDERIHGIEEGADDYLAKPFEPREMLVRLRRLASRLGHQSSRDDERPFGFDGFVLDPRERRLTAPDGSQVYLTGKEFALLHCLLRGGSVVIDRERLSLAVHGRGWNPLERGIDILASKVRLKLRAAGGSEELIRSVRGEGYLLGTRSESLTRR